MNLSNLQSRIILVCLICYATVGSASDTVADAIDQKMKYYFEDLMGKDYKKGNSSMQQYQINERLGEKENKEKITPDLLYEIRIEELNKKTPVELDYNQQVRKFIEIYTIRRKKEFEKILGLSDLYFPIFEEQFDKYNIPLELKYLSVVESSLNPLAVSKSGAVGLWQFLYNTSTMFDLEVNSYIDERRDPLKSSEAAARYFLYLYNIFNDWQLAIASFNGGPGEIRNAIERSGGKTNFWELQPYLSEQTKNYVPAFIASIYVMNYAHEHGIIKQPSPFNYFDTDTIKVKKQVSFDILCNTLEMTKDEMRFLNPVFKLDIIPELKNYATLVLPKEKIVRFLRKENKIYTEDYKKGDYWSQLAATGDTLGKVKLVHNVKKGEFFHKIALYYRCTSDDIKKWNKLESDYLYPGQELLIWVPEKIVYLYIENIDQQNGYFVYTVQEGDTIWSIAEKFNVKSIEDLINMNNDLDKNNIKPGQKIKINL